MHCGNKIQTEINGYKTTFKNDFEGGPKLHVRIWIVKRQEWSEKNERKKTLQPPKKNPKINRWMLKKCDREFWKTNMATVSKHSDSFKSFIETQMTI